MNDISLHNIISSYLHCCVEITIILKLKLNNIRLEIDIVENTLIVKKIYIQRTCIPA